LEKDPLRRGQQVHQPRRRSRTFPLQVPDHAAQIGPKLSRLALGPLSLAGMGVATLALKSTRSQMFVRLAKLDSRPLRRPEPACAGPCGTTARPWGRRSPSPVPSCPQSPGTRPIGATDSRAAPPQWFL
jgi:hypothetical protein